MGQFNKAIWIDVMRKCQTLSLYVTCLSVSQSASLPSFPSSFQTVFSSRSYESLPGEYVLYP